MTPDERLIPPDRGSVCIVPAMIGTGLVFEDDIIRMNESIDQPLKYILKGGRLENDIESPPIIYMRKKDERWTKVDCPVSVGSFICLQPAYSIIIVTLQSWTDEGKLLWGGTVTKLLQS